MDYLGKSYLQCFKYILTHDSSNKVAIICSNATGPYNGNLFPTDLKAR